MTRWIPGSIAIALLAATALPALAQDASIQACVGRAGQLRVVDDAGSCRKKETPLSWAVAGPPGPAGPAGATGPAGPVGLPSQNPACTTTARVRIEDLVDGGVDVYAHSFGLVYTPPVGGIGGRGKVDYQSVVFTKPIDGASPAIFAAATEGKLFPEATLDVLGDDGAIVATYTLTEPVILSWSQGLGSCGSTAIETIGLGFKEVEVSVP